MGFPEVRAQKALLATHNQGAEIAMEWLIQHMEDPDIDDPIVTTSSSAPAAGASPEQIAQLADMGFTEKQARKALKETGGNVERAVEWLFSHMDEPIEDDDGGDSAGGAAAAASSGAQAPHLDASKKGHYQLASFISHKGPSVHCGHYVSHVRKEGKWVLFNDNKVVDDPKAPIGDAYMYIFKQE